LLRILSLFTIISASEIYLLIKVGAVLGAGPVMAIIICTALVGAYLAKRQGIAILRNMQLELGQGRFPAGQMLDGPMVLLGGLLLILPGFCGDILGLFLLFPPSRALFKWLAGLWFLRRLNRQQGRVVTIYRS
jgi:UPF0716 protein FxsA